jgi:predicted nucleic acid-binding protein
LGGILLDTNVVSELMRPVPDERVLSWFGRQNSTPFLTSAVTRAEILLGIALLPSGKRRSALAEAAEAMFNEDFTSRCLPFDSKAATEYALLVAARSRDGRPISTEDGQIAAIALAHNLPLATRNGKDFKQINRLVILDPWASD